MASSMYPSIGLQQQQQNMLTRRYLIQEKVVLFNDDFTIKDEIGQDVYFVRSKIVSFHREFHFEDMAGNGILKIEQEFSHIRPTFNILSTRPGDFDRILGTLKHKSSFIFRKKFNIDSVYGQYCLENLDLGARSFTLTKNGQTVATINKTYSFTSDTYAAEIAADEDQAFILAIVIILDKILYDNGGHRPLELGLGSTNSNSKTFTLKLK